MKIKPLEDRVVVLPSQAETKTESGIFLPTGAQEKPQHGKITAVGPGKLNDDDQCTPLEVNVGDKVLYSKYGGTEIEIDGEKHLIMRESDLLAVID